MFFLFEFISFSTNVQNDKLNDSFFIHFEYKSNLISNLKNPAKTLVNLQATYAMQYVSDKQISCRAKYTGRKYMC
jgi:hypothetical protein